MSPLVHDFVQKILLRLSSEKCRFLQIFANDIVKSIAFSTISSIVPSVSTVIVVVVVSPIGFLYGLRLDT